MRYRANITFWITCLAITLCTYSSIGQFNVQVGYNTAWSQFTEINHQLNQYNEENNPHLEEGFDELHFLHGIGIGLRYKISDFALEATWSNLNRTRNSLLYFAQSDSFDSREYKFGLNSLSIGADSYSKYVGIGAALHYQKLNITRNIGSNELRLTNNRNLNLDLHLNIKISSNESIQSILRPYYRFSLQSHDISRFSGDINDTGSPDVDIQVYGISLLFYNGPK